MQAKVFLNFAASAFIPLTLQHMYYILFSTFPLENLLQHGIFWDPTPKVFPESSHPMAMVDGSMILKTEQSLSEVLDIKDKPSY